MQDNRTVQVLAPGCWVAERFRIEGVLGSGGMGIVYKAQDRETGGGVALKILNQEGTEHQARFEREAMALLHLAHPRIVAHVAHGVARDGQPYLAMELLEGEDLGVHLARGPLEVDEAIRIGLAVAEALAFAHAQGIVHRDLKPQNIFLSSSGVKLLDFGLARPLNPETHLTRAGTLLGTPAYMAPEQIRGTTADARADLFSLGGVLYECLCGAPPFAGSTFEETLASVLCSEPAWLPARRQEIPAALAAIVAQCLQKDPAGRPADGTALLELLRALTMPQGASRREVSATRRLPCSAWLAWGFLADTDRWDRIVGSPRTTYTVEDFSGIPTRVGAATLFGTPARWIERGEWIEGQWGYGERCLLGGPFQVFGYRVDLREEAGGCEVQLTAYAEVTPLAPEGALGLAIDHFERKLRAYLDALDLFLRTAAPSPWPERLGPAAEAAENLLFREGVPPLLVGKATPPGATFAERSRSFLEAHPGEPSRRLVDFIRQAPDSQLRRLRYRELGSGWGMPPNVVLRALLRATRAGLLDLSWEAACPVCRVATHDPPALTSGRGSCALCKVEFSLNFSTNTDVTFRPSPGVRESSSQMFCGGSPTGRPHLFAQLVLPPGEQRRIERLPQEPLFLRTQACPTERVPARAGLLLGFQGADWRTAPAPEDALLLENRSEQPVLLTLERPALEEPCPAPILACPELSELLPACAPELHVGATTMVLLFLEIQGLDDLLDAQGDAAALDRLRQRSRRISEEVDQAGGAVIQESGEFLVASFTDRAIARRAFHRAALDEAPGPSALQLRGVLAEGPALVLCRGGKMELFGRTIQSSRRALAASSEALLEMHALMS
jgi:class 3 adenylate cyclase